jgi:hypothetical protein
MVTTIRFYPKFRSVNNFRGASFLGSIDGSVWTLLGSAGSYIQEGWNVITVVPSGASYSTVTPYRYVKLQFAAGTSDCTGAELEFNGIPVSSSTNGVCPLNVTVQSPLDNSLFTGTIAPVTIPTSVSLSYSLTNSPYINSLSPSYGTALGGTVVTLTGSGFPINGDVNKVNVTLSGYPCKVTLVSSTLIQCTTSPRGDIMPPSIVVNVLGAGEVQGVALYDAASVSFRYLDRWSALTTWKYQEPPQDGDTVIVPAGQAILVDVSPPKLFLVLVQGALVFEDAQDLTFNASYIYIQGGSFEVGSEAKPFLHKLTITLHGDRMTSIEIPEAGAKCLVVMDRAASGMSTMSGMSSMAMMNSAVASTVASSGYSKGFLELHGQPRLRVWTHLANTALAGTSILTLAEDIDWVPGDKLIITETNTMYKTEEVTVLAVFSSRMIQISQQLVFDHVSTYIPAGASTYGFEAIDMRPQVALLSRNVIIQGDDSSPSQLFGVHTAAMGGGVFHVENVELRHCGQQGLLGRYCSHFHMLSDAWNSYVRFNSIHHSFQRGVTIHATNHALVKHNVVYKAKGHTIFIEDGVEQFNVIEENLVVYTEPCTFCTSSDKKPANFWTSSPTNFWRHNVAAGSTHFGFWIELPSNPHGPSYTPTYCPVNMPLGEFFNNTAHGNSIGLRVYPQYFPLQTPCSSIFSTTLPVTFTNNTFFHNALGQFHRNVGDLHHLNARYVENYGDQAQWKILEVAYGQIPHFQHSLFICTLDPVNNPCSRKAIWAPQREFFYASDLTIVNFGSSGALAGCFDCESFIDYRQGGYTYRWEKLSFVNSQVRTMWAPPRKDIFWDLDGSLSGHANGTVTPFYAWNQWPECPRDLAGTYSFGIVCDGTTRARRISIDYHAPSVLDWITMNISSAAGFDDATFRPKETYGWVFIVINSHSYNPKWKSLVDWQRFRMTYSNVAYVNPGEFTSFTFNWIDYRYRNQLIYGDTNAGYEIPNTGLAALPAPSSSTPIGLGNLPDGNNTWGFTMSTVGANASAPNTYTVTVYDIQCPPGGCATAATMNVGNATYWSDVTSWKSGRLPLLGENVVINATQWIIMDVNPPKLGTLTIYGRLSFLDSSSRSLNVDSIAVWGEFLIGTSDAPFFNNAEVVVYGTRYSGNTLILDNNLFLGNKVMAVLGRVSMVGRPRSIFWTKLSTTAASNATDITLRDSVAGSWFPGDRITITSTEYDYSQGETAVIAAVSGNTVTLAAPLLFRHFAGPLATSGAGASRSLAAAVGLLSRNVVFRSNLTSSSDTYGAAVVVSMVNQPLSPGLIIQRQGTVDFRYMEMRGTGKGSMADPSILFQYGSFLFDTTVYSSPKVNYFEGVSFSDQNNIGIQGTTASHIYINNTIFHNCKRNSVHFDVLSRNISITNTLVTGNFKSPDVGTPDQTPWAHPQSGIYMETVPSVFSKNVVAGAFDAGFTLPLPVCGTNASAAFTNNEAHAVRIGAFILPSGSSCVSLGAFTVWKAAHIGVLTVDQTANVYMRNLLVSDSHIGVSMNYIRASLTESSTKIENAFIAGTTLASVSPSDVGASACAAATSCRAVSLSDINGLGCNSILGSSRARAGILMPQYTGTGKTCGTNADGFAVCRPVNMPTRMCSLPWEKRYDVTGGSVNVAQYLTNVTFAGFQGTGSECGNKDSHAIVLNPSQVDMAVPTYTRGIVWDQSSTAAAGYFDFRTNGFTYELCANGAGCDGTNFQHFRDLDGTLSSYGVPGSTVMAYNPMLGYSSSVCSARAAWTGMECSVPYRTAVAQPLVANSQINFGLLQVSRVVDPMDNSTWRVSAAHGPMKEVCRDNDYWPNYQHMITPNATTALYFPGAEPSQMRYMFLSPDATEGAVIRLFLQRPFVWEMRVDGVQVQMIQTGMANQSVRYPLPTDPPGTYLFDPQSRQLYFTVRGGKTERTYDLLRTAAIQLTMRLAISAQQFFGPDLVTNLAILLGIDSSRIRVVDVRPDTLLLSQARRRFLQGSSNSSATHGTIATIQIADSQPTVFVVSNGTAYSAATAGVDTSNYTQVNSNAQVLATLSSSAAADQANRLQVLADTIVSLANAGAFSKVGNVSVSSVSVAVPPSSASASDASTVIPVGNGAGGSGTSLSSGAIAGIVIGVVLGSFLVLLAALVVVRRVYAPTAAKQLFRSENGSSKLPSTLVSTAPAFSTLNVLTRARSTSVIGGHASFNGAAAVTGANPMYGVERVNYLTKSSAAIIPPNSPIRPTSSRNVFAPATVPKATRLSN